VCEGLQHARRQRARPAVVAIRVCCLIAALAAAGDAAAILPAMPLLPALPIRWATPSAAPARQRSTPPVRTATHQVAGDTLWHVVARGENLTVIARQYRGQTAHYTLGSLLADIRRANDLHGDLLRPGSRLAVPVGRGRTPPVVSAPVQESHPVRGIYLSGPVCGSERVLELADRLVAGGGNTVVIDLKDMDGVVTWPSRHPLARVAEGPPPPVRDLPDLVARMHARRLYVVGRLACFLDGALGRCRPDLALRDSTGAPWREREQIWLDPGSPEVRRYLLALTAEAAAAGIDEIQFDYVRYPTNGTAQPRRAAAKQRDITTFLAAARDTLAGTPVRISADLFGIVAWERQVDLATVGQEVERIAGLVDAICPMVYPSHYRDGFAGWPRPAEQPRDVVAASCLRFQALSAGRATIRPWLQAFAQGVRDFGPEYLLEQVAGAASAGAPGWCLWNPAGNYEIALTALARSSGIVLVSCKTGPDPVPGPGGPRRGGAGRSPCSRDSSWRSAVRPSGGR
jgi:hypothetical protein